jgi:glutathione synthase/RimK-type ligase-like ATP-grasp enzyme
MPAEVLCVRIGVVSRFDAWTPSEHPFRGPLTQAGLEYVPIRLGAIQLRSNVGEEPSVELTNDPDAIQEEHGPPRVDAILWRVSENLFLPCRGLLYALARKHVIVNSLQCITRCSDKWATHDCLNSSGLPTVPAQLLLPDNRIPYLGTARTVVKPCFGAGGRGIRTMTPGELFVSDEACIAQPEITSDPSSHVRVLVCDGSAVAAIHRIPGRHPRGGGDLLVNNVDAGGSPTPADLGPVAEIAVASASAVGGLLVGVDLVPDTNYGYAVLEVNSSPGLEGVNRHSPANVYHLAAHAIRRAVQGVAPKQT